MIILVTGGQRSGKSRFAESLVQGKENVAYIATSKVEDKEMEDRVKKHRESRPSHWKTIEAYKGFVDKLKDEDYYLLECVGTMTSNILFDYTQNLVEIPVEMQKEIEDKILEELEELINYIRKNNKNLIIVTNEVGSSLTSQYHLARVYTDILGRVNQKLARISDQAYVIISGIEMRLK